MMFSISVAVQPQSRLHGRLSLIQQIVTVSVVSAIRTVPGYEVSMKMLNFSHVLLRVNDSKPT